MFKFGILLFSLLFLGISNHSFAQVSIGAGTIFNQEVNQLGTQIRLGKTNGSWKTQIKFEKYFLGEGLDLFAFRAGFNYEVLEKNNFSIYTITELNLTGEEGLDIFIYENNNTSAGSFGGNIGFGFQFFIDKKHRWSYFLENDILFISKFPRYFYRGPFKEYYQVAIGATYHL